MRVSTIAAAAMAFGFAAAGKPATSSETEICYEDETTTTKPTGSFTGSWGSWPATKLTTSTLYSTKTYTITKCPASVHNCPAASATPVVTTEIVSVGVTVCPVTEDEPEWTSVPKPEWTKPGAPAVTSAPVYTGTGSYTKPTPTGAPVTAGAGRVAGLSGAAAIAGLVALL
ncbi:hypothetical protein QBC47DRAFT_381478 [Echria macrotheca]|uniref:Uncharacterized protein n=1 Tax=Echria macrotheca TaxID=438768 RepID=A0AAJ0F6M6_9PEZI|nr:hypothetical protein QBC47DRAFT_381478 [Echria macrotheca]